MNIEVKSARRHGLLCLQASVFEKHKLYIVNKILPREERILVTSRGFPDFVACEVEPGPEGWERVKFSTAISSHKPQPEVRDGQHFIRTTEFWKHKVHILGLKLPDWKSAVICRRGWPDWKLRQFQGDMNKEVTYDPVIDIETPSEEESNGD